MTYQDRVKAIVQFGFTERQARFLVTVMLHSGACLLCRRGEPGRGPWRDESENGSSVNQRERTASNAGYRLLIARSHGFENWSRLMHHT